MRSYGFELLIMFLLSGEAKHRYILLPMKDKKICIYAQCVKVTLKTYSTIKNKIICKPFSKKVCQEK